MTDPAPDTPRRILLATDLSCRCDRALDRAVQLAADWHAELIAAYVVEPDSSSELARERKPLFTSLVDRMRRRLRRDLASVADDIRAVVEQGEPAETLLAIAAREECYLIVTGVARDETLGRMLLGSTVNQLVRGSPVPVLVVRDRPVRPYRNILVATDFSPASLQALLSASKLFDAQRMTLFHAYDVPFGGLLKDRDFSQDLRTVKEESGVPFLDDERLNPQLRAQTDIVVERGTPESAIGSYVDNHEIDLTVIGSHGRGTIFDVLIGSTAKRLLESLAGDLMIVHARPDEA